LLRCERKDRAVRLGSSGGRARARKRSPVAEPSWRGDGGAGRHRGGAPQRPLDAERRRVQSLYTRHLFASDHAVMGGQEEVQCFVEGPVARRAGRGIAPRARSLGLEGLDLVGVDLT
jgi:hypothetical protein